MPLSFVHPSIILISGPNVSGKTCFLIRILCNHMLYLEPYRVILVYGEDQPGQRKLEHMFPNIEEVTGALPKVLYNRLNMAENNLIIQHDEMLDASNSKEVGWLFVQESHKKYMTVIFLVLNILEKWKRKITNLNRQ